MTRNDAYHFLLHAHDGSSVPTCARKLVEIARKIPDAPATISAFVAEILSDAPAYAIPVESNQLAKYCARQISEQATARRKTVAELLRFHKVEDQLARFWLTWWGR